ncbi:MAG: DUF882 domain-containing protein [Clostridia bacterium]|nr:DUF882 domain-containing protein [Clostridia bacterium]
MAVKKYPKGSKTKLSKNFKAYEFDCKGANCCGSTMIDSKLVEYLQQIREHFGNPVIINSAYRCSIHNRAVGGTSNSYHAKGQAADIRIAGAAPSEIAEYAESIGIKGIGLYDTFVHVDGRPSKSFWKGHKQIKVSTFGAKKKNAAVQKWQTAARKDGFKLDADGFWGKESEAAAKKAVCKKGCAYSNLTKIIQSAVGVKADGKFGNDTQTAVKAWQKQHNLTPDGIFGLKSWKTLLGV